MRRLVVAAPKIGANVVDMSIQERKPVTGKRAVQAIVMASLMTATALYGSDANARRLTPERPSVEVRLEALRALRRSVQASRNVPATPFAVQQSPYVQPPRQPVTPPPASPYQIKPPVVAARPPVVQQQAPSPAPRYTPPQPSTPKQTTPPPPRTMVKAPPAPAPQPPKPIPTPKTVEKPAPVAPPPPVPTAVPQTPPDFAIAPIPNETLEIIEERSDEAPAELELTLDDLMQAPSEGQPEPVLPPVTEQKVASPPLTLGDLPELPNNQQTDASLEKAMKEYEAAEKELEAAVKELGDLPEPNLDDLTFEPFDTPEAPAPVPTADIEPPSPPEPPVADTPAAPAQTKEKKGFLSSLFGDDEEAKSPPPPAPHQPPITPETEEVTTKANIPSGDPVLPPPPMDAKVDEALEAPLAALPELPESPIDDTTEAIEAVTEEATETADDIDSEEFLASLPSAPEDFPSLDLEELPTPENATLPDAPELDNMPATQLPISEETAILEPLPSEDSPPTSEDTEALLPEPSIAEPSIQKEDTAASPKPTDKKEEKGGFLPNLSSAFSSFLGSDDQKESEPVAVPPSPTPETQTETDVPTPSVQQDTPDSGLPSLPQFDSAAPASPNASNNLPPLPDFGDNAANPSPKQETALASLPPLPFGQQENDVPTLPELPAAPDDDVAPPPLPEATVSETPLPSPESVEEASLPKPAEDIVIGPDADDATLTVVFSQSETEVPLAYQQPLINLSKELIANPQTNIKVIAYASGTEDQKSISKRISLARALAVRAFLIDLGVDNVRISVQALGNKTDSGESERADIFLM